MSCGQSNFSDHIAFIKAQAHKDVNKILGLKNNNKDSHYKIVDVRECTRFIKDHPMLTPIRVLVSTDDSIGGLSKVGWMIDSSSNLCCDCGKKFNQIRWRHHCRACGDLVCNSCSGQEAKIKELDHLPKQRVCNNCWGKKVKVGSNIGGGFYTVPLETYNDEGKSIRGDKYIPGGGTGPTPAAVPTLKDIYNDKKKSSTDGAASSTLAAGDQDMFDKNYGSIAAPVPTARGSQTGLATGSPLGAAAATATAAALHSTSPICLVAEKDGSNESAQLFNTDDHNTSEHLLAQHKQQPRIPEIATLLLPKPGFVIKTVDTTDGVNIKVFINVLQHSFAEQAATVGKAARCKHFLMDAEEPIVLFSAPTHTTDKQGQSCGLFNIVVSSIYFPSASSTQPFSFKGVEGAYDDFCKYLIHAVANHFDQTFDDNEYGLPRLKKNYMGGSEPLQALYHSAGCACSCELHFKHRSHSTNSSSSSPLLRGAMDSSSPVAVAASSPVPCSSTTNTTPTASSYHDPVQDALDARRRELLKKAPPALHLLRPSSSKQRLHIPAGAKLDVPDDGDDDDDEGKKTTNDISNDINNKATNNALVAVHKNDLPILPPPPPAPGIGIRGSVDSHNNSFSTENTSNSDATTDYDSSMFKFLRFHRKASHESIVSNSTTDHANIINNNNNSKNMSSQQDGTAAPTTFTASSSSSSSSSSTAKKRGSATTSQQNRRGSGSGGGRFNIFTLHRQNSTVADADDDEDVAGVPGGKQQQQQQQSGAAIASKDSQNSISDQQIKKKEKEGEKLEKQKMVPPHADHSAVTAEMMKYKPTLNIPDRQADVLVIESAKDPYALLGWQVVIRNEELKNTELKIVTAIRKRYARSTEFQLTDTKADVWAMLKRSDAKKGTIFKPSRKVMFLAPAEKKQQQQQQQQIVSTAVVDEEASKEAPHS